MPPPASKDAQLISRDLRELTSAVKQLTRAVEKQKPTVTNNYTLPKEPEPIEISADSPTPK